VISEVDSGSAIEILDPVAENIRDNNIFFFLRWNFNWDHRDSQRDSKSILNDGDSGEKTQPKASRFGKYIELLFFSSLGDFSC
jgi:hypothetical protein